MAGTRPPAGKEQQVRRAVEQLLKATTTPGFNGKGTLHFTSQNGTIDHVVSNVEQKHS